MKTIFLYVQHFHCFGKNGIYVQVQVMKQKLYNFSDSAQELNVLIFALKTGIAQYKDGQ